MFAPERGCRQLAKRGQNVLGDHPAISPGRVRLAPHRHMLPEISFREFAHRRPGCRARPRLQLLPRLDAGQQHRSPPPCLVGGDHPVPADRNPLRPAGPAALHQINPGSRAIHPHPEARMIPIPVDDVLALDRQPVDNAVRQRPSLQLHHAAPLFSVPYAVSIGGDRSPPSGAAALTRRMSASMLPPTRATAVFSASRARCA